MKKIILVPALLGVMGIGGIIAVAGGSLVGSASELTVDEIKEKALAEVNGTIREVELEKEGSKKFYEIEIVTEEAEYDLKFDASTGELIKKHKDDRDDHKQIVVNNVPVTQNKDDNHDDINEIDDRDDLSKKEQTVNQNSTTNKETIKTEQKQVITNPPANQGKKQDDDYYDDDRYDDDYDDDRYEDDDRYDDDDDDDDYDDDRYDDDDDDDDDDNDD